MADKEDIDDRYLGLVNGYIREEYVAHDDYDKFETSLVNIIIKLLGNIFICFDIYPLKHKSKFSNYNTIFKRDKDDGDNMTFGCSYGINKGIYKVSLKNTISGFGSNAFGIITNILHFKTNSVWFNEAYNADEYFLNGTLIAGANAKTRYDVFKKTDTKAGDVLAMKFDANEWKLTFFLNDKQLGNTMNVKKQTYYLFVGSCYGVESLEYHITIDIQ